MDAQQPPDMNAQPPPRPEPIPENVDPNFVTNTFDIVVVFLQQYGWFILLGVILLLYLKSKLEPSIRKFKEHVEAGRHHRNYDPDKAESQLEKMEAARRKMQEKLDAEAARYAEQQKIKEEEKRKQKIEDWENHLEGKGYRSKYRPKEEPSQPLGSKPKPKQKLRDSDYSPLSGDGPSCSWRPGRRTGGGGGG